VPPQAPSASINIGVGGEPATFQAPIISGPSVSNILTGKDEEEERKKKIEERRKANSLVLGGGAGGVKGEAGASGDKAAAAKAEKDKSSFLGFDEGSFGGGQLAKTSAPQIKATYIGRLDSLIAQGKVIYAVLETAINTDLPGTLRAIITRDVYAESGKAVLIPKGSRVVGEYQTQIKSGQNRVGIMWKRLIRPDGVDLQFDSPGVDQLGRSGVQGFLDNKFWLQIGAAVLTSYIVPALAAKIGGVDDKAITPTTTQGQAGSSQLQQSTQQFQQIAKDVIQKSISSEPTITIDQGTRINIFVNKDIIFPPDIAIKSMKTLK
jgi:type IV secretion system protein VirB10